MAGMSASVAGRICRIGLSVPIADKDKGFRGQEQAGLSPKSFIFVSMTNRIHHLAWLPLLAALLLVYNK
jgi:hypothetical protein